MQLRKMTRLQAFMLIVALSTAGCAIPPVESTTDSASRDHRRQRGVSWVAMPEEVTAEHFVPLRRGHVDWIVQTPFGWQERHDSTRIRLATDGGVFWGETDIGIETTTRLAREAGIETLLKPHIWLTQAGGKWRTDIAMKSDADWRAWFASYRSFILHYAELAERLGIEALCVGTELHRTAVEREADWHELIDEVRSVYSGRLTYAANWYREFEEIGFWNLLDFIGVQAYFPLAEHENPDLETLKRGWRPHLEAIERVQSREDRPVLFTEIGYTSTATAAIRPWEWIEPSAEVASVVELQTQANCYEAFFETFWDKSWVAGAYFWKWYPSTHGPEAEAFNRGFTPQAKPAGRVMARWYGSTAGDDQK
jgi:hypothetical protein